MEEEVKEGKMEEEVVEGCRWRDVGGMTRTENCRMNERMMGGRTDERGEVRKLRWR